MERTLRAWCTAADEEMPRLRESLRQRWPTLIPLVLLISILVAGRTPYLAAFTGITSCVIVGPTTQVSGNGVPPRHGHTGPGQAARRVEAGERGASAGLSTLWETADLRRRH